MIVISDLIGEAIDFMLDFEYIRVFKDAIERIENPWDDEDIRNSLDGAIVCYNAFWIIMIHHQNYKDANYNNAYEDTIDDIQKYIYLVKSNGKDVA